MEKRLGIEGSGASMIVQLMRQHGYNKDVDVEIGTVLTPLPNLSVRLASDGLVLPRELLIVAEHLTEHTRTVNISGGTVSGDVTPEGTLTTLDVSKAQLTFESALKTGDKVIVICGEESQQYLVIDKAVG